MSSSPSLSSPSPPPPSSSSLSPSPSSLLSSSPSSSPPLLTYCTLVVWLMLVVYLQMCVSHDPHCRRGMHNYFRGKQNVVTSPWPDFHHMIYFHHFIQRSNLWLTLPVKSMFLLKKGFTIYSCYLILQAEKILKQAYKSADVQYKKTQQTQHQNSSQEALHSKWLSSIDTFTKFTSLIVLDSMVSMVKWSGC